MIQDLEHGALNPLYYFFFYFSFFCVCLEVGDQCVAAASFQPYTFWGQFSPKKAEKLCHFASNFKIVPKMLVFP